MDLKTAITNLVSSVITAFEELSQLDQAPQATCLRWTILLDPTSNVHLQQCIQSNIALLNTYGEKFLGLSHRVVGGDLGNRAAAAAIKWQDMESAFEGRIKTGSVINLRHTDLKTFLNDAENLVIKKVQEAMQQHGSLKVNTLLLCRFECHKNDAIVVETKSFQSKSSTILVETSLHEWYQESVVNQTLRKVDELQENQSGWSLSETLNLSVNISRFTPLQAGISTFVQVPGDIRKTEGVVNIINKDHYCFLWCIVAALYPVKAHRNLPSSYPYPSSVLDHTGITFPIELKDIPSFEKMNDLRIKVYGIEPKQNEEDPSVIVPLYLSSNLECQKDAIHLLMIETNLTLNKDDSIENHRPIFHFAWIRNLSRLVGNTVKKGHWKVFFCDRCLCHFNKRHHSRDISLIVSSITKSE
ncbi:GSCOCG00012005001-RA-CDS [Cotesia congregata]|nr:GSCOCG00012005001-RA-CDS [Cotesia congregata]